MAKGFQEVLNGNANGAGIVLPDSQTENYAIDEIAKNGLINQRQAQANAAYKAQVNKDFATNKLDVKPTIQYQSELAGLAQKWYDKGVQYRRQNFDPFNPDYSKPDQVQASQQFLTEKKHIEDLAGLAGDVDKNYVENKKLSQEGKLDGMDDYEGALKGHTLQSLYQAGGVPSLPQLYKPVDLSEIDKGYTIKPQTIQENQEIAPGVINQVTHKYVNVPQAASTYEQLLNNHPGINRFWQKKGVDDPKNLYTYNGQNMIRDPNNPGDFGHIDEPGIYHQLTHDYLTDPNLIKQLPAATKKRILDAQNPTGASIKLTDGTSLNIGNGGIDSGQGFNGPTVGKKEPYDVTKDPDFKNFIDKKFNDQIGKERKYQTEIISGVERKLPSVELGDTNKLNATMANLNLRKQSVAQGWDRLGDENTRLGIEQSKWREHLKDTGTREKWINDLQQMHPDALKSLTSAVKEVSGTVKAVNGGFEVHIPEKVPNVDKTGAYVDGFGLPSAAPTFKMSDHVYKVNKYGGRPDRIQIEQVLNKLPTFGKEKGLKTEPYNPSYNNIGENDSADDL